jgi:hypothetical protein
MLEPERVAQRHYVNESTSSAMPSEKPLVKTWRHGLTRNQPLEIGRKALQLFAVVQRLYGISIENKDYQYMLEHYDGEDVLFYLDPPYYHTDDALGISWTKEQHDEPNKRLANLKGKWILTYNDASDVRHLYRDYHTERITVPKGAPNPKETEGLWEYYDRLIISNSAVTRPADAWNVLNNG